jgi:hypothetical protein
MSTKSGEFDQPGSLMRKTIDLLKKKNLIEVSAETKISFYWLRKFVAGTYQNPSTNRVQFLYEYLTGSKLV